jgi:FAD/FMN-containing dehydrogenase
MSAIEDIDAVGRVATVQAGCKLQTLQDAVRQKGLFFPLDLGARGSCTLGGNVSTNAGGINVIRYGMMRSQVLGLEVVLPNGTIVSSMNRMLKNNSGYDLKQLFIGSEGTLGVVTRMTLALREPTCTVNTALIALEDGANVFRLLKTVHEKLAGTLTSFEAMWGSYYRAVTVPGGHSPPIKLDYPFFVLVEAKGAHQAQDSARFVETMEQALENGLIQDAVISKSEAERGNLWKIREDFGLILQTNPVFLYDISLPLTNMLEYVSELESKLGARWAESKLYTLGHIGDGNLHFFIQPRTSGEPDVLHQQSDEVVYTLLKKFEGAISAEHGVGIEKKGWLHISRTTAEVELMRTLKRAIDPKSILNIGKVFDLDS